MDLCKASAACASAFGWNFSKENDRESIAYYKTLMNVLNVASYIPIIGSAVGLYRVWHHIDFLKADATVFKIIGVAQILRGIVEVSSCGLVFLIPDIVVTVLRAVEHYCIPDRPRFAGTSA